VLVLGVSSLVLSLFCGYGFLPAIVALVLAPGARREIRAAGGQLMGLGQIKAGVVCSWVTVAFTVVAILAYVTADSIPQ
jgi:hypothetical protein